MTYKFYNNENGKPEHSSIELVAEHIEKKLLIIASDEESQEYTVNVTINSGDLDDLIQALEVIRDEFAKITHYECK